MPGSPLTVLATRGVGGYRQYRIPAMAVTTTGRIIVAYDARPDLDDLPSPIDLAVRTSDDDGETWSAQRIVRTGRGLTGYGEPSLIVDAWTGRVLLFHQVTENAGFFESVPGSADDDPEVAHVELGTSDDDGETWAFRRITGQLKRLGIEGLFAASGHGAQIFGGPHAGRLLQPCVVRQGREIAAAVAHSDDHGEHWVLGAAIPGTNESKVVALADGTVLLNSRASPRRLVARSHDGGVTFDRPRPDPDLADPGDNGDAIRVDGRPVLSAFADEPESVLCSHNDDTDLRRNLVVRYSPDGGSTWTRRCDIYSGSAGYSVLSRLADGRIGVCYEREGYSQIAFLSIDLAELTEKPGISGRHPDSRDEVALDGDDLLDLDVVLRFVRPARSGRIPADVVGHAVPLQAAHWSPTQWREIGQAGTDDAVQVLHTREDLPRLLGPPAPGLAVGDELRFTARIRNRAAEPASGITLSGDLRASDPPGSADLPPGQAVCCRVVRYFVTPADVRRGSIRLRFSATATIAGTRRERTVARRYSVATGLPEPVGPR